MTGMIDLLADLEARGLVQDTTDRDALAARLAEGPITLYYGTDPTADSMHVGNLIGVLMLRRFADAGHVPIALAGGATGMIGDPSGKSEERNLLDDDALAHNLAGLGEQLRRIAGVELVDNGDWTGR
jgi:tyrosyl-tRNA synthetase